MRPIRSIAASLVAVLAAAALAGPAAAIPTDTHKESNPWYAGESTIAGSKTTAPKADVYVPPAGLWQGTVSHAATSSPAAQPVPPPASTTSTSSGFDWGSAGIGAAAGIAALIIGLGGAAAMRSRRHIQPTA